MMSAAAYFQQNPDVAAAFSQNNYGLTPEQFAQTHFERFGQFEQRTSPQAAGLLSYLQTPALTDQQIASEINRLGVTAQEVSQITGVPVADVQSRISSVGTIGRGGGAIVGAAVGAAVGVNVVLTEEILDCTSATGTPVICETSCAVTPKRLISAAIC